MVESSIGGGGIIDALFPAGIIATFADFLI